MSQETTLEGGGSTPPASNPNKGSTAVLPKNTRILICRCGTRVTYVDYTKIGKVQMPGSKAYSAVSEEASHPIRFTPQPIEGAPEDAGAGAYELTQKDADAIGWTFEKLCAYFEGLDLYGQDYAFLDDTEAANAILSRMHRQATEESRHRMEALAEGVARSDLTLPSQRL